MAMEATGEEFSVPFCDIKDLNTFAEKRLDDLRKRQATRFLDLINKQDDNELLRQTIRTLDDRRRPIGS